MTKEGKYEMRCELCGLNIYQEQVGLMRSGPFKPNGAILDTGWSHERCAKLREIALPTFGDIEERRALKTTKKARNWY